MKSRRTLKAAFAAALCLSAVLGLAACSSGDDSAGGGAESSSQALVADVANMDFEYAKRDMDPSYDEASATKILLEGDGASVEGEGAAAEGSLVTVSGAGTYVVSGELSNGCIAVAALDDAKVQLVLDGVRVHCENGPAIRVDSADKVFVTLAEGSRNTLSDGADYQLAEGEDEPNAVVYSKADLTLNGSGSLEAAGSFAHAVNSKDDLVITGGSYTLSSVEDALRGKDCVKIADGEFVVQAGGDGVKSSNDEDPTRGFVSIDGGSFSIDAGDDGVDAFSYFRVMGGSLNVTTADDAFHSDGDALLAGGELAVSAGDDAFHAEYALTVDGGAVDVSACYEGLEAQRVCVNDGDIHIVASDDGLNAAAPEAESAETAEAAGGGFEQLDELGDFAEGSPVPEAGSEPPVVPEGEAAPDAAPGGEPGGAMPGASEDCQIQINGGYLVVDAGGDGIDSNGSVEVNGGVVLVEGSATSADSALDYEASATVTGGTVLMVGQAGMAQGFSDGTQAFALVQVSGEAGRSLAVTDDAGEVMVSYTPKRSYQVAVVSAPDMGDGESCKAVVGGTVANANADGFADDGAVSGGSAVSFTASLEASSAGFGARPGGGFVERPDEGLDARPGENPDAPPGEAFVERPDEGFGGGAKSPARGDLERGSRESASA